MKQLDTAEKVVSFSGRAERNAGKAGERQLGLRDKAHALVSEKEKREFLVGLADYVDDVLGNRVRTIEQGLVAERPPSRASRKRLFTLIDGGKT